MVANLSRSGAGGFATGSGGDAAEMRQNRGKRGVSMRLWFFRRTPRIEMKKKMLGASHPEERSTLFAGSGSVWRSCRVY
jgi:hypothetical protein